VIYHFFSATHVFLAAWIGSLPAECQYHHLSFLFATPCRYSSHYQFEAENGLTTPLELYSAAMPAFVTASSVVHSLLRFNRDCAQLYLLTESELAGLDFM